MNDKVEIEIKESHYDKSHKNGREYTSVGYMGKQYGGSSPCDTDEEVRDSIERAEETIKENGDVPIVDWGKVKPIATKKNLVRWIKWDVRYVEGSLVLRFKRILVEELDQSAGINYQRQGGFG